MNRYSDWFSAAPISRHLNKLLSRFYQWRIVCGDNVFCRRDGDAIYLIDKATRWAVKVSRHESIALIVYLPSTLIWNF